MRSSHREERRPSAAPTAARRVAEVAWAGQHAQAIAEATATLTMAGIDASERIDLLDLRCESHLAQGDLRFEPPRALCAGADGLDAIRHIVAQSPSHLTPGGWLFLEHGFDQARDVRALMLTAGFDGVSSVADLAGIERVTGGRLTPSRERR